MRSSSFPLVLPYDDEIEPELDADAVAVTIVNAHVDIGKTLLINNRERTRV